MKLFRILALGSALVAVAGGCTGDPADPAESVRNGGAIEVAVAPATLRPDVARPPGVPGDFVPTPNGWLHRSCVYQIEDDEVVRADLIHRRNGTLRRLLPCARPRFDLQGREMAARPAPAANEPEVDGWVTWVRATTTPVSFLSADWRVPSVPNNDTAVVYFFPGLENNPVSLILQPVLAYNGSDAGREWVMYSWDWRQDGNTVHSRAVPVEPGDLISGSMSGTNCNAMTGVCPNWRIRWSEGGRSQTMNIAGHGEAMTLVFSGVLEAFDVNHCSQYPPDNRIGFNNVVVRDIAGAALAPAWRNRVGSVTPLCAASASSTATTATLNWCAPRTCAATCGTVPDGCGGTLRCPPCTGECHAGTRCDCPLDARFCCEANPSGDGCLICKPLEQACP